MEELNTHGLKDDFAWRKAVAVWGAVLAFAIPTGTATVANGVEVGCSRADIMGPRGDMMITPSRATCENYDSLKDSFAEFIGRLAPKPLFYHEN